jgi:hypothetical protein
MRISTSTSFAPSRRSPASAAIPIYSSSIKRAGPVGPGVIAYTKANPDKMNSASAGIGSSQHMSGAMAKISCLRLWLRFYESAARSGIFRLSPPSWLAPMTHASLAPPTPPANFKIMWFYSPDEKASSFASPNGGGSPPCFTSTSFIRRVTIEPCSFLFKDSIVFAVISLPILVIRLTI